MSLRPSAENIQILVGIETLLDRVIVHCAARGLLHNKLRFETFPPVGTFPRGWYVYRVDGPEEMERN